MPDPARLRDSTQIVLHRDTLDGIRCELEHNFMLTIVSASGECDEWLRLIGSPVEIKNASRFLGRHGVSLP
ncbi:MULTISPECIES: hypothetical protein [unclassified Haladaptatus]|uniref:VNG_1110C family protein n=1 Tax=unclassified Haladaptatus TaxID=2622732 RepID=UPI00209C16F4|nr:MULTISPECIES: hypothetical protein [unclassified Haladaptatus]MCO8246411.1 hypothetical protein [Haladaptatus sp. AB643]MCO8254648.1 hypothetical protein [Haladaptatus sp. AB618]